jgi:hypothetical protein
MNGLLPTLQVDDRQAPHTQPDCTLHVKTVIVRPAMADRGAHPSHQGLVNVRPVVTNYAYDSTHTLPDYWPRTNADYANLKKLSLDTSQACMFTCGTLPQIDLRSFFADRRFSALIRD